MGYSSICHIPIPGAKSPFHSHSRNENETSNHIILMHVVVIFSILFVESVALLIGSSVGGFLGVLLLVTGLTMFIVILFAVRKLRRNRRREGEHV